MYSTRGFIIAKSILFYICVIIVIFIVIIYLKSYFKFHFYHSCACLIGYFSQLIINQKYVFVYIYVEDFINEWFCW